MIGSRGALLVHSYIGALYPLPLSKRNGLTHANCEDSREERPMGGFDEARGEEVRQNVPSSYVDVACRG